MNLKAKTWKQKCDAVTTLKGFAVVAILGGLTTIGLCFITKGGGHDLSDAWWVGLLPSITGIATLFERKFTAVLFSIMSVSVGTLFILTFFKAPLDSTIVFPVLLVSLCCIPVILTYRGWDALK